MFTWSGKIRTLAAVALAGVVLGWSAGAVALPIALFDTGEGVSMGSADLHYTLTLPGDVADTAIASAGNPVWVAAPAGSYWIGPLNSATSVYPIGLYTYALDFDLTGMDVGTASISGSWAADNDAEIYLNGVSTGIALALDSPKPFAGLTGFAISSGFVAGVNTLEFRVNNATVSPTGLLVSGLSGSADELVVVPEPGVALLVGAGLIGLGAVRRRS